MLFFVAVGVAVGLLVAFITIKLALPQLVNSASQQLIALADQKLGAQRQDIGTDLKNKKEIIEDIARRIKDDLEKTSDKLEKAERERIGSFGQLKEAVENQARIAEKLNVTTEGLAKVLSGNSQRGQFGEQVAEDLLKMSGFVRGVDYDYNKEQKQSGSRPDFTIYLPNKVKINIDVKFPYNNLQKMAETTDKGAKLEYLRAFTKDIKDKIKQITTREYINPEENTVDFVLMFIPNEMIFSFIYEKLNDVWLEAMRQKVVMAGPFSFTAILRMVRQAYDNFRYQKNVQKIISYIKTFEIEFAKYNEEFKIMGERIESLSKKYYEVDQTRKNKLLRTVDRIKLEEQANPDNRLLPD
ncbi:DNA recombination protein RmuC [Patescibacteria group bacterium]|nr:DNA recombination protein RmuC [Patescibacteria group bacterium]MCL5091619.1 DNA recombination protein RmuC [Patescibacteria group bacterium]